VEEFCSVEGTHDGATRRRRRPQLAIEVRFAPTKEGYPPGDQHPYRHLDEEGREELLLASFLRILRDGAEAAGTESPASSFRNPLDVPAKPCPHVGRPMREGP
jgi:hypothetical protein